MKALKMNSYGGPDVITMIDVPKPTPQANEILVRVITSPVSMADTMLRRGTPKAARLMLGLRGPKNPFPGTGFAGIVEETGAEVADFSPGDAVFGETGLTFAAHSEYIAMPADGVVLHKPESFSFQQVAPLIDGALTSMNFLTRVAALRQGEHVLINGASGSLGTMAVQIAKTMGAEVTAVCSAGNADLVKRLGADHVIDYRKRDFTKGAQSYDVIYDTLGIVPFRKARRVLRRGGRYVSPVLDLKLLFDMLRTSLIGSKKAKFAATGLAKPEVLRPMLQQILQLMQAGQLQIIIDRIYGMEDAVAAHEYVDTGHKVGNVILQIAAEAEQKASA